MTKKSFASQTTQSQDSLTAARVKVPAYERLSYSLIDGGYSMLNFLMTSFVTIYLTDTVGIAVTAVSMILIVSRIFDAINDPLIGSLADRTESRFGRYKPWVFFGSFAAPLMVVLMFSNNPNWSSNTKTIYALVIYLITTIATTAMYIPQLAMNSVITSDPKERNRVTRWRNVASSGGTSLIPLVGMRLILGASKSETPTARGYTIAVTIIGVVALLFGVIGAVVTKERLQPPKKQKAGIPVKLQMRAMFKNLPIILLMMAFVMLGLIAYGRGGVLIYYFTYYVGNVGLYSLLGLTGLAGSFIGPLVIATLMMRFFPHKGKCAAYTLVIISLSYIGMAFTNANGAIWWVLAVSSSLFQGALAPILFSAVPEAGDYGEYLSGFRVDGFLSSAISFGLKFGSAVGPALFLAAYDWAGYIPNQAEQSQKVLQLMNATVTYIPGLLVMLMGLLMFFGYKLSPERHESIMAELRDSRAYQI